MLPPVAKAYAFIRKPVEEVFSAFADADVTKRFWFSHVHGQLEAGAHLQWHWQVRGVSVDVQVVEFVHNETIAFEWDAFGSPTRVIWSFKSYGQDGTGVGVTSHGFTGERATAAAIEATEGFSFLLVDARMWLEHAMRTRFAMEFPSARLDQDRI